jgi:hypothetical protein
VVLGKPLDVVVERVDPGRGDDPRLPHRAAEEMLAAPRLQHQRFRPGEERAERAAEPLREAERDRVEVPADLRRRRAARHRRVHEPRAVEVDAHVELAAGRRHRLDLLERPDPAAGRVVRVLDDDEPRRRDVHARPVAVGGAHLLGREPAGDAAQAARHEARVHGRAAELGEKGVRVLLGEHLLARLGEDPERDLVRHRRRRQVDRGLVAEELRAAPLELVHGRVLALLLVAHDGARDRLAHRLRRPRGGVGTKINHRLPEPYGTGDGRGRLAERAAAG